MTEPDQNVPEGQSRNWHRSLLAAVRQIEGVIAEASEHHEHAVIYVTPGVLYLLAGPSHEGIREQARRDRILIRMPISNRWEMGDW